MILQLEMIYGCISQGELRRTHSILHYATIAFVYEGSEGDTRDFLGERGGIWWHWEEVRGISSLSSRGFRSTFQQLSRGQWTRHLTEVDFKPTNDIKNSKLGTKESFHIYPSSKRRYSKGHCRNSKNWQDVLMWKKADYI